jgi:hypothetical protein
MTRAPLWDLADAGRRARWSATERRRALGEGCGGVSWAAVGLKAVLGRMGGWRPV